MKKLLVLFLLVGVHAFGQGDIFHEASWLGWEHDDIADVEEFRMYCQLDTPNVVVGAATLVGTIIAPTMEWPIILSAGHWYCVVTAFSVAMGESAPSNEWEGTGRRWSPQNLQKK